MSSTDGVSGNTKLFKFITEGTPVKATTSPDVLQEWEGQSVAVIFCEVNNKETTQLSELVLLHEVLTKRYGFAVYTVTSADSERVHSILREVTALGTKRLFLYFVTAMPSRNPHSVALAKGSSLSYSEVLREVRAIDRVVLAHCQSSRLNVATMLRGQDGSRSGSSSLLSLAVTEAAVAEIKPVRCWLFDGLLTPAVTELLSLDENRVLCPEDIVMYAVTALSSHSIDFGSFMDGESFGMVFFAPVDTLP
ncbi:hypothetical protein TRVL_01545 [Trypanosoma vivax]|nr:hypothetical protein TRVL_01545 [Trypanosoma vivax]